MVEKLRYRDLPYTNAFPLPTNVRGEARESKFQKTDLRAYLESKTVQPMGGSSLERRGLCFVRFADDIVIYVKSRRAGERVLQSVTRFITRRMRLKVNADKSGVNRPWISKLLGFTFTNSVEQPLTRLHWKTVKRMKERVRELTGRSSGRSVKRVVRDLTVFLRGWWNYFGVIQSRNRLARLDVWIRRRLRSLVWK